MARLLHSNSRLLVFQREKQYIYNNGTRHSQFFVNSFASSKLFAQVDVAAFNQVLSESQYNLTIDSKLQFVKKQKTKKKKVHL